MNTPSAGNGLLLLLGNQLFSESEIAKTGCHQVFMAEDLGLCTEHRHHKLKILMFFTAMRAHRDALREAGYTVYYHAIEDPDFTHSFVQKLDYVMTAEGFTEIHSFEIEDHFFEDQFAQFTTERGYLWRQYTSPMFLCSRDRFATFVKDKKTLRMASFYQVMRRELRILVDEDQKPLGGRWSFDEDNRKKLPKNIALPDRMDVTNCDDLALKAHIEKEFADHPGALGNLWMPTTRQQAWTWLENFLDVKFAQFGPYEDAISHRDNLLFHSALSPVMNLGLLTPREVVDSALEYAKGHEIPINSLEGFVRQIIGWREFIRGVYHTHGEMQKSANFWGHQRRLTHHWYDASTGIPPLDDAIQACQNEGYTHHIPRLMVIANLMTLARIHPDDIYRWFMEMFVDSSDWVMVPNVYGMATFADGGIFATKPYLCGSNYLLKMSDYKRGPWCDLVDGLYWLFMQDNRDFFQKNPRLAIMPRALDKLDPQRKKKIFGDATTFVDAFTEAH